MATITTATSVSAATTAPVAAKCAFLSNAPKEHVVVKGDTLWDVSGRFLERPWCWPQVWNLNRDQIRDPHWIYPGQVVTFDPTSGTLRLKSGDNAGLPEVKLSPGKRATPVAADAVPSIPSQAIAPFISRTLIADEASAAFTPRVVAVQEGRKRASQGDVIFVQGVLREGDDYQLLRPGRELRDPQSGELLAREADVLGTARLQQAGGPGVAHRFVVTSAQMEIDVGTQLTALTVPASPNTVPHAAPPAFEGRIAALPNTRRLAGRHDVVVLSRGAQAGLDVGSVLKVLKPGAPLPTPKGEAPLRLPDEDVGTLFVFRTFDRVAYALVMDAKRDLQVNDLVRSPE